MEAKDVFTLGLGLSEPWKLFGQRLDIEPRPHELHLEVVSERGALFARPECGRACKAPDFAVFTWQHRNCSVKTPEDGLSGLVWRKRVFFGWRSVREPCG